MSAQPRDQTAQRLCRESLIDFIVAVAPWFTVEEVHLEIAAELEALVAGKFDRLAIFLAPRAGKLVAHDTPVYTPEGWKIHGDLKPGDQVFGPDGLPTTVVGISPDDWADVEVELTNGEIIRVHENHEWTVWDHTCGCYRTVETRHWLQSTKFGKPRLIWSGERGKRGGRALYGLPDIAPLQGAEQDLPLDPYVFGAWLGDGTAGKPVITHHIDETAIVVAIAEAGFRVSVQHRNRFHPNVMATCFAEAPRVRSPLTRALQATGAYRDKHIPPIYLQASVEQRLQLLAGLIDTDGTVDRKGRVQITTASTRLRNGILDLLRSLAQRPYCETIEPRTSTSGVVSRREHYRIGFQPTINVPTKLSSKRISRLLQRRRRIGIAGVRRCPPRPGRCIQIDRADGLYLVGRTMVPTHNSQLISRFFPAWYLGKHPNDQVMQVSYKSELSTDHGRAVRDLITDPLYQGIFPGIRLRQDVKAAGHWMVEHPLKGLKQGEYYASGVTGGIAGRGWNLGIIDDPLSEQDAKSDLARKNVRDWYGPGFYTRRQPERNAAVLMSTRWAADDLPGHLLDLQNSDPAADRWRVVEVPAILTSEAAARLNRYSDMGAFYDRLRARKAGRAVVAMPKPIRYREGDSYAPRRWGRKELDRTRGQMIERDWSALYLQRPVAEEGNILKRAAWREWRQRELPQCYEILTCYDTAIEEGEEHDYSARTTWGLFDHAGMTNALLIEAWRGRLPPSRDRDDPEGPGLIENAEDHAKQYSADRILIEKRASGSWLIKELRKRGLPARAWLPPGSRLSKGKVPRAWGASVVLEGGAVWYVKRRWADQVIDECADFPFGAHDDWCFVAGTLIALRRGLTPIEEVRSGDEALTPVGWRRVATAGFTGIRPVVERGPLTGTPTHPVFFHGKGWGDLTDMDTVSMAARATLCSLIRTILQKPWSSMALSSAGWAGRGDTISVSQPTMKAGKGRRGCTWRFGSTTLARLSQKVTRSTTETGTLLTVALRTWSAYRRLCIERCLGRALERLRCGRIWPESGEKRLSGTDPRRAASGIAKTRSEPASCSPGARNLRGSITGPASARYAAGPLSAGTRGEFNVGTPALTKSEGQSNAAPVFNLSVEGVECYYANGVLVHNCDTVTMALLHLRERWKIEIKGVDDREPDEDDDGFEPLVERRGVYG